jgi:predicted transcriptional regulator
MNTQHSTIFPCEVAVWKALPAIKSAFARALVDRHMTQKQVADLLATTEASISHYVKGKRGSALTLGPTILEEINHIADRIIDGSITFEDLTSEMCRLCKKVRTTCAICGAESLANCNACKFI